MGFQRAEAASGGVGPTGELEVAVVLSIGEPVTAVAAFSPLRKPLHVKAKGGMGSPRWMVTS